MEDRCQGSVTGSGRKPAMTWERIGYAALCVIVPVAWGLMIYAVSTWIEKRLRPGEEESGETPTETLPLDYHI